MLLRLIGFGWDVGIAAIFVAAGYWGRQRQRWAMVAGIGLYALDALILVPFGAWLSFAFHALALWGLWGGLRAMNGLSGLQIDSAISVANPDAVEQAPAGAGPPRTLRIFVLVAIAVAACLIASLGAVLFLPGLVG